MNRKQQRLELILIPLDNFCETYSSTASSPSEDHSWKGPISRNISPLQVIYSEVADTWINVHDLLYFLDISDTQTTFIWASEETGYRHLYLVTSSFITIPANVNISAASRTFKDNKIIDNTDISTLVPRILKKVCMTYNITITFHHFSFKSLI